MLLVNKLKKLYQLWEDFWWAPVDGRSLFFTRVTFGISAVLVEGMRFWNMDLFDHRALSSKGQALELFDSYMRPGFPWTFWPDSLALVAQSLLIVLLILFTLGWTRRPLIFLAWVLHLGFVQRNVAASMGVDSMITVFLFYLSFAQVWKRNQFDGLTRVTVRMLQVHLSIIYFYTGLEKLRGATWWEGSSLWLVLNNTQVALYDLTWMAHFPAILGLMAHVAVLFELFWPAFMWNPHTRRYFIILGILFHTGIAVVLDLWGFSALMLSQYFLFIKPEEWKYLETKLQKFKKPVSI